ncbi:MAG: hypothetical protein KC583_02840, partial [Myxococcales bacterium]|nr:hypothetical protein [Myxococcales bacterium]
MMDAAIEPVIDAAPAPVGCTQPTRVRVEAVDAWGRPISGAQVAVDGAGTPVEASGAGSWAATLTADDHLPTSATLRWDGRVAPDALAVEGAPFALTGVVDAGDADGCGAELVALVALEHAWFASTARPWSRGNRVTFFATPDRAWADIVERVRAARRSVTWATWWWKSDALLVRSADAAAASTEAWASGLALGLLEDAASRATVRVLVNQFLGEFDGAAYLTTDAPLRAHADDPDDGFELVAHGNAAGVPIEGEYTGEPAPVDFEARARGRAEWADVDFGPATLRQAQSADLFDIASFHQKAVVVDGQAAYVIGMNTQSDYWDTSAHAVFEPRRMPAGSTPEERAAVAARAALPAFRPFRDFAVRIDGPAAANVEAYLAQLWNAAIERADPFSHDATPMEIAGDAAGSGAGAVQIQMTLPPPHDEQSILEGQRKAIAQARRYILVEDQYWRATRLLDDLVGALEANPDLVLMVLTNAIGRNDGGKKWTIHMDETLRAAAGDRYVLLQPRAFDVQTGAEAQDGRKHLHDLAMYLHSKLMIVDDRLLVVGSANKNNRSLLYDGEMNAAVLDPAVAKTAREAVLKAWVGPLRADRVSDDPAANLALLREVADFNQQVLDGWNARWAGLSDADIEADRALRPLGIVFPYRPEGEFT